MYADDVVFYVSHQSHRTACSLLQEDATLVYNWFSASGLCINTDKTKIISFGSGKKDTRCNNNTINISMGGNALSICEDYEYLGIHIDSNLNLDKMVSRTVSTSSCRLSMFGRLRDGMSKKVACLVYKQTIAPVLEYCGYLYNGWTTSNQQRLQRVQNRCLRVCLKVRLKHSIIRLHKDTDVNFLGVRHDIQLLLLIHKYVYGGKHDPSSIGMELYMGQPLGLPTPCNYYALNISKLD